jgi:hypothetical protein
MALQIAALNPNAWLETMPPTVTPAIPLLHWGVHILEGENHGL